MNFKYEALKEKLLNSETSDLEQDHNTNITKKERDKKKKQQLKRIQKLEQIL